MSDITFGRLQDLEPRDAWAHEARGFTPWLADNIDQLSDVIGVPLELTGTEMAVETFSADLIARNPQDNSTVLIENQLEVTDHTHLGQIMTYLSGLEAQMVIWIAARFREPHLSAVRWLNEKTPDDFQFFAIKLRVVRIGDGPYAPVFEIVEKPNDWDREIKNQLSSDSSSYYDIKHKFWRQLQERHPDLFEDGFQVWRYPNNYIILRDHPTVQISAWVGKAKSGIFVRSGWGEPSDPVNALLSPHRAALESKLGAPLGPSGRGDHFLASSIPKGHADEGEWHAIMDWMSDAVRRYRKALEPILA